MDLDPIQAMLLIPAIIFAMIWVIASLARAKPEEPPGTKEVVMDDIVRVARDLELRMNAHQINMFSHGLAHEGLAVRAAQEEVRRLMAERIVLGGGKPPYCG